MSRWRAVAGVGCVIAALALLVWFWRDLCLWRADAELMQRRHEAAAAWVARGLWFRPAADASTCLRQLRIARRRQDFAEVERKLREAAELGAPAHEVERERLLAQAQSGRFNLMHSRWPALLSDQRDDGPEIALSYYNWSMLRHELVQAEKALKLWHEDYPRDPEPLALMGRFYEARINWEAAEEAYRNAFALAPGNDDYRLAFAKALQVRLKTQEAIPLYEDYRRRHPGDLVALEGLAQCAATKGDIETALELLRTAFQANPDNFAIQKAYGELLLSAGDPADAIEPLEKAYRAVPEHANLANALARALKACGRTTEAEPLFAFVTEARPHLERLPGLEMQLRKDPEDLALRMEIASLTARYVSRRDAIRWYEALLHVDPDYVPAHAALADLYQSQGDAKLAGYHASYVPHVAE